jgi:DNA alkylation repair enzyme
MVKGKTTAASVANEIRRALKAGGSPECSSSVQRFFKEEVQSHGWRTADLRWAALRWRREILQKSDLKFLLQVADYFIRGNHK